MLFVGCLPTPTLTTNHNAVIPLDGSDVGVFIPESWEKLKLPAGSDNVVLLARNGAQNFVMSLENGASTTDGISICDGAEKGFSPFEIILENESECRFRGKVSETTPMREFWQKIVKSPKSNTFLLASCSQEIHLGDMNDCSDIIYSFGILDKK